MNDLLRGCAIAAFVVGAGLHPLAAQWGATIDLQRTGFGGTSFDTSTGGTEASYRPGNSPAITLRFDRRLGRVALGIGVRYSRSAVVLDGKDVFVGLHDEVATIEAAPEVRVRLLRTRLGATINVYAGPVIGAWMLRDEGTRGVAGVVAGVVGEFPLIDRVAMEVRVGGGLTGSLFRQGELPPVFERRTTRRSEIGLGIRYGR